FCRSSLLSVLCLPVCYSRRYLLFFPTRRSSDLRCTSFKLRACSTRPSRTLPLIIFWRFNQRSTVRGLLVTQNNPASSKTISASEIISAPKPIDARSNITPDSPISTSQMVETAEETTKNQAHKAMVAPQARCTWKVKRAENAGPAGKVVDQALEASEIAVASFTETLTPPATMSCCITPLIATSDARDAMMTITTAKALAWL